MDDLTVLLTPAMIAMIPLVAVIIQTLKKTSDKFEKYSKLLPYLSVVIAFGLIYLLKIESPLLPAIIIGLAASGGYDMAKKQ